MTVSSVLALLVLLVDGLALTACIGNNVTSYYDNRFLLSGGCPGEMDARS
jgi:hypothetical protein